MYPKVKIKQSKIQINESIEGETIEMKMLRMVHNNETTTDNAPLLYQERREGVPRGYDIRTDRFDVALESMTVVHKSEIAKRDNIGKLDKTKDDIPDNAGGSEYQK